MIKCPRCKIEKQRTEFKKSKSRRNGLSWCCSVCLTIYQKQQSIKNTCKKRENQLKTKYGINNKQYNQLFKQQNGKCKICSISQNELFARLVVDHDHKTKKVRALLCHNCNTGLGLFKENINSLIKAIEYLQKF